MTENNSLEIAEIEKAYKYCESVTRFHAKSFYFAAKFLPKIKQKAVFPVYAFCRHVDDEIDERGSGGEREAAESVRRWEEDLREVYKIAEEEKSGIPNLKSRVSNPEDRKPKTESRFKVLRAWSDLLKTYEIPLDLPLDLIRGVLMDTSVKRYETFEDLYVYCYRVASTVGLMSAEILGYKEKRALEYAEAMGVGMQLTNILRDVREDAARGRIYLPLEDLRKFNVSEKQIFAGEFDANFREMMKFQISRARNFYENGEKGIPLLEKDARFTVLLASRIYAKILGEIEKADFNIFLRRVHTSAGQKLFAIPKIWREAGKM